MDSFDHSQSRILAAADSYLMIVGNILGIGIFTATGYIAAHTPDSGSMLVIWILGAILAGCGGLTYAELSTRFPVAGGDIHYLSAAFHPVLGFLFGWSTLFVTYTGSIAVIAVGFAHYFLNFFGEQNREISLMMPLIGYRLPLLKLVAMGIVLFNTLWNVRGVRWGVWWQGLFTVLSMVVLMGYIGLGFWSPLGNWANLLPLFAWRDFSHLSGLGVALIGVYFTYSGWTVLAYIAGEIKDPRHTIPRAIGWGVFTVSVLYLLINLVYLYALPVTQMVNIVDIGHQVFLILWGSGLSFIFTALILVAVLSTLNSTILSGARIYYAMSREKKFFDRIGRLHPQYRTPAAALWLQSGWTVILILSGSFNQLLTYTVFVMVLFGFLSGLSLFILRRRNGPAYPAYSTWGFPLTPLVYVIITGWIMINTLVNQPVQSLAGIGLILLGVPFYWYFKGTLPLMRNKSSGNAHSD